jgi:hypothetical protein
MQDGDDGFDVWRGEYFDPPVRRRTEGHLRLPRCTGSSNPEGGGEQRRKEGWKEGGKGGRDPIKAGKKEGRMGNRNGREGGEQGRRKKKKRRKTKEGEEKMIYAYIFYIYIYIYIYMHVCITIYVSNLTKESSRWTTCGGGRRALVAMLPAEEAEGEGSGPEGRWW